MADQLTEHLGHVLYNPSFRRDAASFLSLPKESVDELADLVERHGRFDVPSGDVLRFEQVCDLKDQGRQVLAAAQLIRQAVRGIGPPDERRQSLTDFAALMKVDPFQPDDFSRFFSPLPKLEREERRNAAVAVAPTVVESQLYWRLLIRSGRLSDNVMVEIYAMYQPYQKTFANKTNAITDQIRLTGPIQFLVKLLETWNLSRADAIPLLGLEDERAYAGNLLAGRARLRGRDLKHRIACLFRIRKTLYALFRDEKVENDWLREPHDALDGQKPMDVMLEGSMENLLLVKEYAEAAAGL